MKAVYKQMKKTFREKIMQKCMSIAKKHKLLKYPCIAVMAVLLSIYYICRHFATNGKRYIGIAFSLLFFVSSCSFSFAVFTGQPGFINTQETYNEIVEDSDVEFATEKEVELAENIIDKEKGALMEYESSEDIVNGDSYTLDDILESTQSYAIEDEEPDNGENGDNRIEEAEMGTEIEAEIETEAEPDFDSSDWRLILINKQHPIPEDYSFNLGTIKGNMRCDERIISDVLSMLQAAKADGINLKISSPYRTDDRQETNFNNRITLYMKQGYSYMEAYKVASRTITIPGASEHQVGLALDITSDTYSKLEKEFADTEAGKWLAEHSCEYGFILRYPDGKEYITSIEYEPWHFRYVGKDAATVMTEEEICLEEFWDKYL